MAYAYKQIEAHDPSNPGLVAPNASVTIFEPGDPAKTPLTLTTLTGEPLPNPVTVNGLGYGPAFMHATLSQVAWSGGGLTGTFESYEGLRDEAVAARDEAANAAANAVVRVDELIAAGNFEGPAGPLTDLTIGTVETTPGNPLTDEIIAAEITEGTATNAALVATMSTATDGKLDIAPATRTPRPLVVFTFDDGPAEDLTVIKPILDGKGVKGSFAINPSTVGTSSAKLTWPDVRQLRDEDHEILDHSYSHANLGAADDTLIAAQMDASNAAFLANGITPAGFAWPYAASGALSRKAARRLYPFAVGGTTGTTQPLHTYAIKRVPLNDTTTLAAHKAQIDAAITNNEVLIFLSHSGTEMAGAGRTLLADVIDYAQSLSVPVVTAAEAFNRVGNIFDAGDLPGGVDYTVVDGQGRLKTSVSGIVVAGAINPTAATAPNSYQAGVITVQRVSGPGNTDWPKTGTAGNIITNRLDTASYLYTSQQFISDTNTVYTRRAASDTTWSAWSGNGVVGSDAAAGNLTPDAFPLGTVVHTIPLSGSTGPSAKQGMLSTTRASATSHNYTTQVFHEQGGGTMHRRMGLSATTWSAWKAVTLT